MKNFNVTFADLEGKTDLKIRALEVVEELRTKRADKQVMIALWDELWLVNAGAIIVLSGSFGVFVLWCWPKSRRSMFFFKKNYWLIWLYSYFHTCIFHLFWCSPCFSWMPSIRIGHLYLNPCQTHHLWHPCL